MPKSRKQKTGVKKKNNPSTRKKRIDKDVDTSAVPLLESTTENETGEPEVSSEVMEDFADVSEERASIISIVKDLEGQVDTAYELKEVLEAELDLAQEKLSEESAARAELEQQVKSLEAPAALAEQLREDISFAEEERNKFANSLAQTQQQLKAVTEERDLLTEQTASSETHTNELESEKTALEAQVMNLKDKVTDMDRLCAELAKAKKASKGLDEQVQNLSSRLKASNTSKGTLEKDLAKTREQVKNLREKFETAKNELDAFKKAMRDIRSEATQTSGRVRQRYFKPSSVETLHSNK